jgi:methionyl-tRNA formyltransferase
MPSPFSFSSSPTTDNCHGLDPQEDFLQRLAELQPDLAVTAAYGNMLPQRFLDTPRYGTLNVHPSLLPRYRGAAPVQRALEVGARLLGRGMGPRAGE